MTTKQERLDQEQEFEQLLAELRAEYGPENVSIFGKHSFPELTLIYEDKDYEPSDIEFGPIKE